MEATFELIEIPQPSNFSMEENLKTYELVPVKEPLKASMVAAPTIIASLVPVEPSTSGFEVSSFTTLFRSRAFALTIILCFVSLFAYPSSLFFILHCIALANHLSFLFCLIVDPNRAPSLKEADTSTSHYPSHTTVGSQASKAPQKGLEDSPHRSTSASEETQDTPPHALTTSTLQESTMGGPKGSPHDRVRVQVEEDLALVTIR